MINEYQNRQEEIEQEERMRMDARIKIEREDREKRRISEKSRLTVTLLSLFLGCLGVHRFYLSKIGTGVLMLITGGGFGIWSLIDFIMAVTGTMKDKDGRRIEKWN